MNWKDQLQKSDYADYYGLRDFYSLIKLVSRNITSKEYLIETDYDLYKIIKRAIERNFGKNSKVDGAKIMGASFTRI